MTAEPTDEMLRAFYGRVYPAIDDHQKRWDGKRISALLDSGLVVPAPKPTSHTDLAAVEAERDALRHSPRGGRVMAEPRKYRKKPVVVEAVRFEGNSTSRGAIEHWMAGGEYFQPGMHTNDMVMLSIETIEGVMRAVAGDWIIRGTEGEFYPCKPAAFAATYEPVSSTPEATTEGE